ncbi:MAG TPA: hypothetical protein VEJ87_12815, partial [Acidimicrobiales bacterium]|nr:hypothetical protein [Acidimicrobiales bacterium]
MQGQATGLGYRSTSDRAKPESRRVVRILPDVTAVHRTFDYTVPEKLNERVVIGTQVRIILNNRRVGGWVIADEVTPPLGVALRPISAVRGWGPPPAVLELARWTAWRWAGADAQVLRTATSATAVRNLP